jgi:hypothetical protein
VSELTDSLRYVADNEACLYKHDANQIREGADRLDEAERVLREIVKSAEAASGWKAIAQYRDALADVRAYFEEQDRG